MADSLQTALACCGLSRSMIGVKVRTELKPKSLPQYPYTTHPVFNIGGPASSSFSGGHFLNDLDVMPSIGRGANADRHHILKNDSCVRTHFPIPWIANSPFAWTITGDS